MCKKAIKNIPFIGFISAVVSMSLGFWLGPKVFFLIPVGFVVGLVVCFIRRKKFQPENFSLTLLFLISLAMIYELVVAAVLLFFHYFGNWSPGLLFVVNCLHALILLFAFWLALHTLKRNSLISGGDYVLNLVPFLLYLAAVIFPILVYTRIPLFSFAIIPFTLTLIIIYLVKRKLARLSPLLITGLPLFFSIVFVLFIPVYRASRVLAVMTPFFIPALSAWLVMLVVYLIKARNWQMKEVAKVAKPEERKEAKRRGEEEEREEEAEGKEEKTPWWKWILRIMFWGPLIWLLFLRKRRKKKKERKLKEPREDEIKEEKGEEVSKRVVMPSSKGEAISAEDEENIAELEKKLKALKLKAEIKELEEKLRGGIGIKGKEKRRREKEFAREVGKKKGWGGHFWRFIFWRFILPLIILGIISLIVYLLQSSD